MVPVPTFLSLVLLLGAAGVICPGTEGRRRPSHRDVDHQPHSTEYDGYDSHSSSQGVKSKSSKSSSSRSYFSTTDLHNPSIKLPDPYEESFSSSRSFRKNSTYTRTSDMDLSSEIGRPYSSSSHINSSFFSSSGLSPDFESEDFWRENEGGRPRNTSHQTSWVSPDGRTRNASRTHTSSWSSPDGTRNHSVHSSTSSFSTFSSSFGESSGGRGESSREFHISREFAKGSGRESSSRESAKEATLESDIVDENFYVGYSTESLFPSIFNLAATAEITCNATCGLRGQESYCKLVEHTSPMRAPQCGVCDARSSDASRRHPISNAVDGSNRWWQSPTLEKGRIYEWVTITLDLKQMYQIAYVIVKAAISPRPGNWILERSIDGVHYTPWQYYAVSDAECLQRYGIQPRRGKPTYRHDTEVICTSYYSKLNPLEGGEIHTSLVNGRPGAAEGSEELKEFTKARYVRMRLQKIRTLNADLMGSHLGRGEGGSRGEGRHDSVDYEHEDEDEEEEEDDEDYTGREDRLRADPSVTRRYFYSIKDISIGGRCVCNGHARDCTVDTESGLRKCRCEHNACGEGCEQCCPLFNQRPWQPGVPCQSCHCHGHAPACKYDPEVARARASMDPDGVYRGGGGVCMNCTAHTTGVNCEKCQDGWYRPSGVSASDSNPCRACRCHPTGSISPNCASHNDPSGAPPGSCICRPGFTGPRCDRCAAGRRRFPECEACMCDLAGSQGNDPCPPRDPQHASGSRSRWGSRSRSRDGDSEPGQCVCKRNVEGPLCNRCRKGFFALQESNPLGCTPCYCSGLTPECQEDDTLKLTASSSLSNWLVTDLRGRRVSIPSSISAAEANKDPLTLDIGPDEDLLRYELSRPDPAHSPEANDTDSGRRLSIANDDMGGLDSYYWQAPPGEMFLGEKLATYGQNLTVGVSWVTARGDTGGHPTNGPDLILEGGGYTIAYGEAAYPGISNTTLVIPLAEDAIGPLGQDWYHVSPGANDIARSSRRTDYRTNEVVTRDQMMQVLGDLKRLLVRSKFHTDQIEGGLWEPSIQMGSATVDTGPPARRIEICKCPPGYEGASCQHCSYGYVRVSGRYGPECRQCDCNGHAATCDTVTGRCSRCEHNTYGEHCEYCSTGFFGDARVGTPDDCQQCRCPHHVKSNNFSPTCERREGAPSGYICTRCPPTHTGHHCERCAPGHFGNPMEIGSVCRPCQCGSGSTSSGMMMVGGRLTPIHCDSLTGRCLDCKGNTEGWNCERCKPLHYGDPAHADCKPCSCNTAGTGGVASCDARTGQCRCLEGYTGRTCDRCKEGRGGISLGCPPCDCDPMGTTLAFGGRTQCDPRTGQCPCRAGAAGRRCESCIPNYYHSPSDGCKSSSASPGRISPVSLVSIVLVVILSLTVPSSASWDAFPRSPLPRSVTLLSVRVFFVVINFPGSGLLHAGRSQRGCYYVPCASPAIFIPYNRPLAFPRGGDHAGPRRQVTKPTTTARPRKVPRPRITPKYTKEYESWKGLKYGCGCHKKGSDSPACDIVSGQCLCKPNVIGRTCDQCRPGYWGLNTARGCRPCSCDPLGSVTGGGGAECDQETGRCNCKPGVGGTSCNRCLPGYYGFSEQGCKACEPCDRDGHVCDPDTGRCICPPFSEGDRCQNCMPGSWRDPNSTEPGCKLCACDPSGMLRVQCNPTTGRCVCRRGFGGPKCSHCAYGFYGFPSCRPCDCDLGGTDPRTCDANAVVPKKKKGSGGGGGGRSYYREGEKDARGIERGDMPLDDYDEEGYDILDYNKGSECACDQDTGHCQCKPYASGRTCNQCKDGTFGLSKDNPHGCIECFCFGRSTSCTQSTVSWSQIRMPYSRTVHIEYDSPNPTFRPGGQVSPVNTQEICYINFAVPGEEGANSSVSEGRRKGDQHKTRFDLVNNLQMIPGDAGDLRIGVSYLFDTPIYWQLPRPFLDDKILSYGGYLRFAVEDEGGDTLLPPSVSDSYPLVQLQGNQKLVLEHFPSRSSQSNHYQVRLHESEWRLKNHPQFKVTREMMMLALQNIQHILIRATDSVDLEKISLHDVTMDVALESPTLSKGDQYWVTQYSKDRWNSTWQPHLQQAYGVELCECPAEYGASSCQDPSIGFYRWRSPWPEGDDVIVGSTVVIISRLAGEARPCRCNGRSRICDKETGHCLNCTDNTGGPSCETCALGHYGDLARGIRCQPCPCPGPGSDRNFADSCTVVPGRSVSCKCHRGYTGPRCDRCSYGFFGWPGRIVSESGELEHDQRAAESNPSKIIGTCRPCLCNPIGSVSDECHERTGECNCRSGVTGRDCSQCKVPGTVLSPGPPPGCISCKDNCTGVLLAYSAEIGKSLASLSSEVSGITPVPWGRLEQVETRADDLEAKFAAAREAAMIGIRGEDEMGKLRERSHVTVTKAKEILISASHAAESGNFVWREVTKEERDIKDLQKSIKDVVEELRRYGGGADDSKVISIEAALNEARRHLSEIRSRGREFESSSTAADEALRVAEDLLRRIRHSYPDSSRGQRLRGGLESWSVRLEDLDLLLGKVASTLEEEKVLTQRNAEALESVKGRLSEFVDEQEALSMAADEAARFNSEGELALRLSENSLKHLEALKYQLGNLTERTEQKESLLARLNPIYEEKYVRAAQRHADELMARAEEYRDRFNATREVASYALQAAQAYRNIVEALEGAKEAAKNASLASKIAYSKAYPSVEEMEIDSLPERALDAKGDSEGLLEEAAGGRELVEGLKRRLDKGKGEVNSLQSIVNAAADAERKLRIEVERLEKEIASKSPPKVKPLGEDLGNILDEVNAISGNASKILRPELEQLKSNTGLEIQTALAEAHVEKAWTDLREAKILLDKREKEAKEEKEKGILDRWKNNTLAESLQLLRDRIAQARHTAHGIHLSLSGPGKGARCVRSYRPGLEPSTASSILVTFAINGQDKDSLLLYIPSETGQDFMALEVIERKVRFSWDVGGGVGEVTHPLHIRTARDLGEDKHWYRIDVERTGNVARLWVRPQVLPEGSPHYEAPPVSNATAPGYGRIDFLASDQVWVGGWGWEESQGSRHGRKMSPQQSTSAPVILHPSSDKPSALKAQRFVGCLHQVVIDGKPLGLWNFIAESPGGACTACIEGAEEIRDESAYSFSGASSYSVLHHDSRSPYNKYVFSVSFTMRSFDEDAILFLAISRNQDRYISIVLRNGKVVFRIGYGGDSRLELSSEDTYNKGEWVRIEASRAYDRKRRLEKGLLKVSAESRDGAPSPPPSGPEALPDLSGGVYYIGGTPPGFSLPSMGPLVDWGVMGGALEGRASLRPFRGCLYDLQVVQEGYNPLRGQFYGVEASCPIKPARVVSFYGNGYLEMDSHALRKKASLGFVFRSPQPNALLLLSTFDAYPKQVSSGEESGEPTNEDDEELTNLVGSVPTESSLLNRSFYSVTLDGGRVEARVEAGKGEVRLRSEARYDDNRNHAVTMIKTGRRVELRVDDRAVSSATLPEGATQVRAPESGGLFLGGVPQSGDRNMSAVLSGMAANFQPLLGTIQDFVFNDELIRLDKPASFLHVGIGRNEVFNLHSSPIHSTSHYPEPNDRGGYHGGILNPGEIFPSGIERREGIERGCRKVERYSLEPGAVKLGDKPGSHIRYLHRKRSSILLQRNFSLGIVFRTHYPNGLLFMVPGGGVPPSSKKRHSSLLPMVKPQRQTFLMASLKNGQLLVFVHGKRKHEVTLPGMLNDGKWHNVTISKEDRKLWVSVEKGKPIKMKVPKRLGGGGLGSLGAGDIYIGGIPDADSPTGDIWISSLPENIRLQVSRIEYFKGCVRDLSVDGSSKDLVGDRSTPHRVGQCFPTVETGSYFPGDAYAVYKTNFHVGSLLELELEFRTSELTGVLLSVSEPSGSPALSLELHNGKVLMAGDMGDGRPFRVEQGLPPSSPTRLCDGRWHKVQARYVNDELTLRVDHMDTKYGLSGNGRLSETDTHSPLYIGGLPDNAPSGTLQNRDNFKGCIRNIMIGGERRDWTDMASLTNVLLSSCPVHN